MKKLLLLGAAAIVATGASALDMPTLSQTAVKAGREIKAVNVLETKTLPGSKALMQVCQDEQGRQFKRLVKLNNQGTFKAAVTTPSTIHQSRADVQTLAESFETGELPEGWSTYSDETCTAPQPWRVDTPMWVDGYDGEYACYSGATFDFEETYDEWLLTPSFEVKEDYMLSYLGAHDLIWMVNTLYLDYETSEFTEYQPAGVFKVWAIDEETGEKTLIHDFFEDVIGLSWDDLIDCYTGNLENYKFSLNDFVGKTIKIGFENVGSNGNSVYVDKVVVDVPEATCSYEYPDWSLFWGLDRGYRGLSLDVALMPAYTPLTWTAESEIEDATFIWDYYNNDSEEDFAFDESITETYTPDYSSVFSTHTNLFYSPTLYCMADGYSMGSYSVYDYFQAGGRPDFYQSASDSFINLLVHCSCHATEGFTNIGTGRTGIPAFGYGELADGYTIHDFWSKYLTGAASATADPKNWAKFQGVTNFYSMPAAPLVVNKVVGFFMGTNLNAEAEFVVEISVIKAGETIPEVIASTKCSVADAECTLGDSYYAADFVFEQPVVLSKELGDQFIITWTGFDKAGEYVAVMSNYWAPVNGINHGYAIFDIMQDGSLIEGGMLPLEAAIEVPGSFGMMMDAEMPWLESGADEVNISEEPVKIGLDSFYDGADLTIEAPEWIEATVEYRWCQTVLTLTQVADGAEGTVTVKGPGVSTTIKVYGTTGIKEISAAQASEISEIYTLQGIKVEGQTAPAGVYIARYANGSTAKIMIR